MSKKAAKPNYEKSIAALEATITKMEQGDMPLEEALKCFEEGVRLSRECQQLLADAEQRVTLLTAEGEEDFSSND